MLVQAIKNTILSFGQKLEEPVFIKEFTDSHGLITELENLSKQISDTTKQEEIAQDIKLIRCGDQGEKNVMYELKNSFIPMYVLHNIVIQQGDYKAQIDYILVTKKFVCILETKKLNGDITINNDGDFIREFKNRQGKTYKKEGMHSPISQNQRHVRIVSDYLLKNKIIKNTPVVSLVVIANSKSIINHRYAKKEIKNQIVKYDQLTPRIKEMIDNYNDVDLPIKTMHDIAQFLLNSHKELENAFITKYKKFTINSSNQNQLSKIVTPTLEKTPQLVKKQVETPSKDNKLRKELTQYRLHTSRKEEIKAYLIFNNKQLDDIIEKMPKNEQELLRCNGFGEVKVKKYGSEILSIINSNHTHA